MWGLVMGFGSSGRPGLGGGWFGGWMGANQFLGDGYLCQNPAVFSDLAAGDEHDALCSDQFGDQDTTAAAAGATFEKNPARPGFAQRLGPLPLPQSLQHFGRMINASAAQISRNPRLDAEHDCFWRDALGDQVADRHQAGAGAAAINVHERFVGAILGKTVLFENESAVANQVWPGGEAEPEE